MEHQQLFYQSQLVFEYYVLEQPYTKETAMPNEACFLYNVRGTTTIYAAQERQQLSPRSAVLMRCGQYLSQHLPQQQEGAFELLAVHFHPKMIQSVLGHHLGQDLAPASTAPPAMVTWQ